MALTVAPLDRTYDRAAFSCGVEGLDRYLKQQARQDVERRLASCHVLHEEGSASIQGYYTLSATSINLDELPESVRRRVPRYDRGLPAALLGRLAVDERFRGRRLRELLLADAVQRILDSPIAVAALVVDAIGADAARFYERYGFRPFADDPLRLYLPLPADRPVFPNP